MRCLTLLALAAPLVSAIKFTSPSSGSILKKGSTYNVEWNSVDTDPSVFSIFLVNFVNWPPFYTQLASDVKTSAGEYKVTVPCDVSSSLGFQFNAINGTNVYVIHAQTSRFSIADGTCSDSNPAPSFPSCAAVTVTKTATVTLTPSCSDAGIVVPTSEAEESVSTTAASVAPSITTAPFLDDAEDDEGTGITSTVYSTVFKDLSEVEDCVHMCDV